MPIRVCKQETRVLFVIKFGPLPHFFVTSFALLFRKRKGEVKRENVDHITKLRGKGDLALTQHWILNMSCYE